MTRVQGVRF